MLKALLWKEWQEQRWHAALATVWLLGMMGMGLRARIMPDAVFLGIVGILTAIALPAFVGMQLFASERKNGTLVYLMVQPVSRSHVLAAKVIVGLLAWVTPMLICGIVVWLTVGGREINSSELMGRIAVVIVFGSALFAWQLLAGLECRREETYLLASAMVLTGWILHGGALGGLYELFGFWALAVNPFALLIPLPGQSYDVRDVMTVQSLVLVGLAVALLFRFLRLREGRS